jgi:hypothetical protein
MSWPGMKVTKKAVDVIPEMVHKLGRYWEQPAREKIMVDEHHAYMDTETFRALKDYSVTNPTGVYSGKMWKRYGNGWVLCWYEEDQKDPTYALIHHRRIVIEDGPKL